MNRNFISNASSSASSSSTRDADSNEILNSSHAAALAENQAKEAEISGEMLAMKKRLQSENTQRNYKKKRQLFIVSFRASRSSIINVKL